jgi:Ca-activated chloride channel homolog
MQAFLWPWLLALLLLAPLLVWLYRRGLKPPAESALVHPDLALIAQASLSGRRWLRHLPALLYLAAILVAVVALARPTIAVPEAHPQAGIVLALDISLSMRAADVEPSRIDAAKSALKVFVHDLPKGARAGLVTFAGYATLVVPLTDDHERIVQAVDFVQLGRGTVIGEAMLESLKAFPSLEERQGFGADPQRFATIVLLSDGANRGGVHPFTALEEVKRQQVTVHTIGVGSPASGPVPGAPEGMQAMMRFDETTLRTIAEESGGRFAFVDSAEELHNVYRELGQALVWRFRRDEATALASLAAAALLLASLGLGELRRRVV